MKFTAWALSVAAITSTLACYVRAQGGASPPVESSWIEISDDPSRKSLFEDNIVPAKLREDEKSRPKGKDIIGLAIPKDFIFPDDAKYDKILKKDRENAIFGIDISHYTGTNLNFANLTLQRVRFVYAKATQGIQFKDPLFAGYWSELSKLQGSQKLYRGAYHFLTADEGGAAQADRFVDYVDLHGGFKSDDMPPCLDLEWDRTSSNPDRWKGHDPDDILRNALDWMVRVKQRTGRTPMLYTALSWWRERGIPENKIKLFDKYTIWIADYSRSHKASETPALIAGRKQNLWQFASDARLTTGYPDRSLDANIFYGTIDKLEKDFDIKR